MSGSVAFMGFCADTISDGKGRAPEDLPRVTVSRTESGYLVTGISSEPPK